MPEKLTTNAKRLRPFILGYMEDVVASNVFNADILGELNKIIYFPITGKAILYDKTAANLTIALASCADGEIVVIHGPCTLTGDFDVPSGVGLSGLSRTECEIVGTITMGEGSLLEHLTINATANDANPLYGVTGPYNGSAKIYDCDITVTQSGAGNAYAVGAVNGIASGDGDLIVEYCYLNGSSVGGDGYCGRSTAGELYVRWSRGMDFSTDRFILT